MAFRGRSKRAYGQYDAVQGLFLSFPTKTSMSLWNDPFLKMRYLRLLKIYNVEFRNLHYAYVSKYLQLLEWHQYPLKSLPPDFKSENLVEIKMPSSSIKQLWNGKLSLRMLIVMDLSHCQYLATTPNMSEVPNLKRLILEGCISLSLVHPTIMDLQRLALLNMKGCARLKSLPDSINLRSLRTCILSGCSNLTQFSKIVENMDALAELYLDGTAIRELPESIQHLKGLILLNLSGCRNLLSVPSILCSSLKSLKFLYLSLCSSMDNLPDNIGCLEHLEELDACNTAIRKMPESTSRLKNLKLLCFHRCSGLELPIKFSGLRSLTTLNLGGCNLTEGAIPDGIGDLLSLQSLDLSENNFCTIPESISRLSELAEISLFKCIKLQQLPKLGEKLVNADLRGCPLLSKTSSRRRISPTQMRLSIINCRKAEEEFFITKSSLKRLKELDLSYCQHLEKIPDLNGVPNLKKLNLEGCADLESLPDYISLEFLEILILSGCSKLKVFPKINGDMVNFSQLHLDGTALQHLQLEMKHLKFPISINLRGCRDLSTVPVLLSLRSLNISSCSRIFGFPNDLGSMVHLEELDASETAITQVNRSIIFLEKVKVLSFCGCKGLKLPRLDYGLTSLTSLNLRRCGLTEEVLDILCGLCSLKFLDLGENKFVTMPDGIGRFSFLHQLDLSRNNIVSISHDIGHLSSLHRLELGGNSIVCIPHEIGRLSSLQVLDLSGNSIVSIPHAIGDLSSLQVLDLSDNSFTSIPESISHLSKLTELRLFRCSKLQSLPSNVPFNLKHVHAQECPVLERNADILTIWASGKGLSFINRTQLDDQPSHVPVPKDRIELHLHTYIADRVYGKMPFEIRFPRSKTVPNLWKHWSGLSVTIPLSDRNSTCMGLALFVSFEILDLEKGIFNRNWELGETICEFHTDDGCEKFLVFQNFIDFTVGSYALCCYEPRGGKLGRMLDKPCSQLRASVSTKRKNLKIIGCGIHLISEDNAEEFVESLANQTPTQLDSHFDRHCKHLLDEETVTSDPMELGSTSTSDKNSCSKSICKIKLSRKLSILYEGRNGREKSFHFCFPASVVSTTTWFFHHHAGDITLCDITRNLLDDQRWVGLELYAQFSLCSSTLISGNNSFFFYVDLCSHDHGSPVMHESLKINSCVGNSDQLVVLHVPRVHFQQQLNQCHGISALFRIIHAEMEVQVCGSRLVFEHDLEGLTQSITVAAGKFGQHFLPQLCSQAQPVDRRNAAGAEMHINCFSLFRSTAPVLPEQAPSSSIVRLRNYRCYLHQQQGSEESDRTQWVHFRSGMLLHSKHLLENKDRNQENVPKENKSVVLARHHVRVMAETQLQGTYSSAEWKKCLQLLLRQSKVATLSVGGRTISAIKNFDPSSTYSVICFSVKEIPVWFKHEMSYQMSSRSRVGIKLPPRLHEDENWRGLAICVSFEIHDRGATTSPPPVKLLCHLRAKDNYCLNPIPMCSINVEKILSLHVGRFIWLTFIPRIFLTELNAVSDVEARIYVSWRGLRVEKCGIRLLYRQEEEFENMITGCWTSFFDDLSLIRQLVEAND